MKSPKDFFEKMTERKLKLALLGRRNLINPAKWSVRNILKLASIGKYHQDGKIVSFRTEDPEIEARAIRPADIPLQSIRNIYDIGITGVFC